MARVIVFDVNETLLDLTALDSEFLRVFGDAAVRRDWFQQLLQLAFVSTITENYVTFGALGAAALQMVAERRDVRIEAADAQQVLGGLRKLPPHPDVVTSLQRLRDAGLRLATLTNSTMEVVEEQLRTAGIRHLFEQVLSGDVVRRLKPAAEAYRYAARELGVTTGEIVLVAAHAWDIAGARHAGCGTAYVARPGMVADPLAGEPEFVGPDLRVITEQILCAESGKSRV